MSYQSDLTAKAASAEGLPDPHDVVAKDEEVPLDALFSDEFVRAHSGFDSFDQMVAASPSDATTAGELGRVTDGEWDAFVAETTDFADESEMVFAAIDRWVAAELGL
ncbi:hypothetical protein [Halogeometricum limi]|uniref:Uncharacterized protein n=1 Tax=Halogeometricum limi TaxID=555875 RepID=A0A1I6IAQ2_9EURY|nr:hypothetical protein [Halogeometricum limi]SFR63729.1 hypothetical protein SAMN04488124_2948 [Halogeometricum limi]